MYNHHSDNGTNQASVPKRDVGDVLLEVDDWKLIKAKFQITGVDSYPVHMCGRSPEGYGVYRIDIMGNHMSEESKQRLVGRCIKCNERMPDEIAGLWTLHNWDVATNQNP